MRVAPRGRGHRTAPDHLRRAVVSAALLAPAAWPPAALAQPAGAAAAFATVLGRLRAEFLGQGSAADAQRFVDTLPDAGLWPDVDYADQGQGDWRAMVHLVRLRAIALASQKPEHSLHGKALTRQQLERGLRAWLVRKPVSTNWWHNTIGQQMFLAPILVLTRGLIDPALAGEATGMLFDPTQVPPAQTTGQNLIWYATQQVIRGCLRGQAGDVAAASAAFQSQLRMTTAEGIQADHSFHQHEAQLYSGGYGLGFLQDNAKAAAWLAGTPWAFATPGLELLADYALKGVLPLIRGDWLDWGARGREFTRDERVPRPRLVLSSLLQLQPLVPSRGAALKDAVDRLTARTVPGAGDTSNTHFWRSDFMVQHTRQAYVSVKMVSARTVGTESGNGENLQGYWLPFGVTYVLRRGDEYDGLPPVWDWSRLPGLTAPAEVPAFQGYQRHAAKFVGGVSDGVSGVAAMRLDKLKTQALRAWFFHGDLMVALGAGIRSTHDAPVHTTLNQTRWVGEVSSNQGPLRAIGTELDVSGRQWLWHDGVTYLLMDAERPSLGLESRQNTGKSINSALGRASTSERVWTLSLAHGTKPQGARYGYGLWFGAGTPAQAAGAPAPLVLSNTELLQAVRHADGGPVQAVFHRAGVLALDDNERLTVDAACIVMALAQPGGGWRVLVADPTRTLPAIGLRWLRKGQEVAATQLILPAPESASPQASWAVPR